MQTYSSLSSFLTQHWVLSGLVVVVLLALFLLEHVSKFHKTKQLSANELVQLINREGALVLDTRPEDAFKQGHIIHSKNIASDAIETQLKNLAKHKDKPVVLLGGTDQQAASVLKELKKQQFANVKTLGGGIKAWKDAGLPLEK